MRQYGIHCVSGIVIESVDQRSFNMRAMNQNPWHSFFCQYTLSFGRAGTGVTQLGILYLILSLEKGNIYCADSWQNSAWNLSWTLPVQLPLYSVFSAFLHLIVFQAVANCATYGCFCSWHLIAGKIKSFGVKGKL